MNEHTAPLALDQPQTHTYEPPHWTREYAHEIDAGWATRPGDSVYHHPRIIVTLCKRTKTFGITPLSCASMDAGVAMKLAAYMADAVRWATGEIEKLNTRAKENANA